MDIHRENIIIPALDFDTCHAGNKVAEEIADLVPGFKVGMELFHVYGPSAFRCFQYFGEPPKIFYDGKLLDIPTTIRKTLRVLGKHNLWMTTIHSKGGPEMLRAAREGALQGAYDTGSPPPKLLLVGPFTSTDTPRLGDAVVDTVLWGIETGMDGVICPPKWARTAKEIARDNGKVPDEFLIVCPGIRPEGSESNEHLDALTPLQAKRNQADYLVIGRPITQSKNPRQTLLDILKSLED